MKPVSWLLGTALLTVGVAASAQTTSTTGMGPGPGAMGAPPPGPPPEIVAACSGQPTGTQVNVMFRDGKTRTITCGERPPRPPQGGGGRPGQPGSSSQ